MDIEFLGTAGAIPIPRTGCHCPVCEEARVKGVPFRRSGPGIFIRDLSLLIDTSEDAAMQLDRAGIDHVKACLYSHWHPDHTMGCRIFEIMNADSANWPRNPSRTDVYLPEQVAEDAKQHLGLDDHLRYMEEKGWIRMIVIKNGFSIEMNGWTIKPIRLAEPFAYAFLFEMKGKRVLIAPDELHHFIPDETLSGIDLAILPVGLFEFHPLTRERLIPVEIPELKTEATFNDTLSIIRRLKPKRCYLTHIKETDRLSHEELKNIAQFVSDTDPRLPDLKIAYDGLRLRL
ncbi:hypothetical protein EWI07_06120 [Sporolactobacillus sp. THM7-4]|nr:hypothetical protein EWI07_06120 [Sporolactobacillus sp. THM7-4]